MGSQLFSDINPISFTNQDITEDNPKTPTRTTKKKKNRNNNKPRRRIIKSRIRSINNQNETQSFM